MDISLLRFFRKPTVADFVQWCRVHEVKPPSPPVQEKLKETAMFADRLPWRVQFHRAIKKAGS